MTTHFDETRIRRGKEMSDKPDGALSHRGIDHLAALALSALAAGRTEAGLSAEEMAAIPHPHVTALTQALADPTSDEAEVMVAGLLDSGLTARDVCLSYFAPAAEELGRLWQCDELPFTEVSMATARMQVILRSMPGPTITSLSGSAQGALFAAVPGETHTLGVLMAADHFRRLGWDVGVLVGVGHDSLCRQILADDRPLLGLSCSGGHTFRALCRLIDEVRDRRPSLAIVVSGGVTANYEAMAMIPECDGIIDALETAEMDLPAALEQAQARLAQTGATSGG